MGHVAADAISRKICHAELARWVKETAALTKPESVWLCDGSASSSPDPWRAAPCTSSRTAGEYFAKFGERLPEALQREVANFETRLSESRAAN